ncbi:MAG: hypothetical protein WC346_00215 [Methanogenium sp.]|jgi:hypothetical protein
MAELGLGADIKEVYTELGTSISIISRSPIVTGEKLIYEINSQATKPFIREHHIDCTAPYDSLITTDDIIEFDETGDHYLVMNKTPEMFEDAVVEYNMVLYKCNLPVTAHILRPIEIRDPITYKIVSGWHVVVDAPVYGLISDRAFGSEIAQEVPTAGQFPIWRIDLYLPKSYDVKPLDRLLISSTEYYKIETIEKYYYPGVNQILLVEDTRTLTTIIGDQVYSDDEYD